MLTPLKVAELLKKEAPEGTQVGPEAVEAVWTLLEQEVVRIGREAGTAAASIGKKRLSADLIKSVQGKALVVGEGGAARMNGFLSTKLAEANLEIQRLGGRPVVLGKVGRETRGGKELKLKESG